MCLGNHWTLCLRGFRCRGRLGSEVSWELGLGLGVGMAILHVLSSSRLMSFLVAILAVVGGDYYCWSSLGRLLE